MGEVHTLYDAQKISDPTEQLFAIALIHAFPQLSIHHEATIAAYSGKKPRMTVADFKLTNAQEETLYIEIASGERKTGRKAKQQKTARLAGLGNRHVTFYGAEVGTLVGHEPTIIRQIFLQMLYERFSPRLFDFST